MRKSLKWGVSCLLTVMLGCSPPPALPKDSTGPSPLETVASPAPAKIEEPPSQAQTKVLESSAEVSTEVADLARQLVVGKSDDRSKALALYDWIARNIRYDIEAYISSDLPDPSPSMVLSTRTAVCEGYARLFVAMAQAIGLEAVMVTGYSKGFAPDEDKQEPDHAWNAVKLGGEWALLDPTWGAGHIDDNRSFVAEPSRDWFDTPAEEFLSSHFPEDPKWQLVSSPISKETFLAQPSLSKPYFDYELQLQSHQEGQITSDGALELRFSSGRDCRLMASLYQKENKVEGQPTLVERQGRQFHVYVEPPEAGEYRLVILAGPPDDNRTQSAVVYHLSARQAGNSRGFPKTMLSFSDEQIRLLSPRSSLQLGQEVELSLLAPRAAKMMAVLGEEQIPFQREGDRFELSLTPEGETVKVFANYDGGDQYVGLLEYPVLP